MEAATKGNAQCATAHSHPRCSTPLEHEPHGIAPPATTQGRASQDASSAPIQQQQQQQQQVPWCSPGSLRRPPQHSLPHRRPAPALLCKEHAEFACTQKAGACLPAWQGSLPGDGIDRCQQLAEPLKSPLCGKPYGASRGIQASDSSAHHKSHEAPYPVVGSSSGSSGRVKGGLPLGSCLLAPAHLAPSGRQGSRQRSQP